MSACQAIRLLLSDDARKRVINVLDKAQSDVTLDLAEMRSRRAGPGVIAMHEETLSAIADTREQLKRTP